MGGFGGFIRGIISSGASIGGHDGMGSPSGAAPAGSYLLDTYGGASAAYSVFQLSSTATNSLRVRRSSDNAEQDIGFVSDTLDTASLLTFVGANDGFVTTYYDQSGNSSNFTQSSASNQPMIVNAGVVVTSVGVPAVKFDGINEYLSNTVDLFGEARLDQFFLTDTDGDTAYIFPSSNVTSYYGMIANSGNTSTVTTSPSYGSPSLYQNGVPINVTNRTTVYNDTNGRKVISHIDAATSIWTQYRFGFWSAASVYNFGGSMSALVAYASDQSANRVGIETILDSLYNVYDPDATAYITAAGITDPTEQAAVNQLVLDLKGTGSTTNNTDVWSDSYGIHPLSPTSLTAAKYNLKDPTKNITWNNPPTHATTGVTGNGTNAYGDTGINILNDIGSNNFGLYVRVGSQNTRSEADMGAIKGSSPFTGGQILPYFASGIKEASNVGDFAFGGTAEAQRTGLLGVQYNTALGAAERSRNGVVYSSTITPIGTTQNLNILVLARGFGNSRDLYTTKTHSFYAITNGDLTANQIADLFDAQDKYNTAVR
jgi:hypothetical protein